MGISLLPRPILAHATLHSAKNAAEMETPLALHFFKMALVRSSGNECVGTTVCLSGCFFLGKLCPPTSFSWESLKSTLAAARRKPISARGILSSRAAGKTSVYKEENISMSRWDRTRWTDAIICPVYLLIEDSPSSPPLITEDCFQFSFSSLTAEKAEEVVGKLVQCHPIAQEMHGAYQQFVLCYILLMIFCIQRQLGSRSGRRWCPWGSWHA